jgi:hypothetical protein
VFGGGWRQMGGGVPAALGETPLVSSRLLKNPKTNHKDTKTQSHKDTKKCLSKIKQFGPFSGSGVLVSLW